MQVKIFGSNDKTQSKIGIWNPEPLLIEPKPMDPKNKKKTEEEKNHSDDG